jgi:predicted small lipoprotein YifL
MLRVYQILVSGLPRRLVLATGVVAALAGCGQRGPLFLPTTEAAAGRATLPQTIMPATPSSAPSATGTASPLRTP